MNYLVDPQTLVFNAHCVVGFTSMVKEYQIPQWDLLETALEIAEEWTSDWSEDEGFGSSDMTYMLKEFVDNVICKFAAGKLMTKFTPTLSIVEYSEAKHHSVVEQIEGII